MMIDTCLCARVEDLPDNPIEGAVQKDCSGCGEKVWLGPAAQIIVAEEGIPLICLNCVLLNAAIVDLDKSALN